MAQIETGMVLTGVPVLDAQVNGRDYVSAGNRSRYPAIAPHGTYRCAEDNRASAEMSDHDVTDDNWLAIVAETEEQWTALCEVLDAPDLASDDRFASNEARLANEDALDAAIAERTRQRDAFELMYALQGAGVPAGACQRYDDKLDRDPQHAAREFYRTAPHDVLGEHRYEGYPVTFLRRALAHGPRRAARRRAHRRGADGPARIQLGGAGRDDRRGRRMTASETSSHAAPTARRSRPPRGPPRRRGWRLRRGGGQTPRRRGRRGRARGASPRARAAATADRSSAMSRASTAVSPSRRATPPSAASHWTSRLQRAQTSSGASFGRRTSSSTALASTSSLGSAWGTTRSKMRRACSGARSRRSG